MPAVTTTGGRPPVNMKYSLVPKQNKNEIYHYLFKEGVMVVEKNTQLPQHPALKGVPNLHVMLVMRSLKSKNIVVENYNWRHFYYVLTDEGVDRMREILQIPTNVSPATHTIKPKSPRNTFRGKDELRGRGGRGGMRRGFQANRE